MKRIAVYILLLSLALIASLAAEPVMDFQDTDFDFGWIPYGSIGLQYVLLRSIGTDTLIINDIITSSANVLMPLERQAIAPGDSLIIPIIWQFGNDGVKESQFCRIVTNTAGDHAKKPPTLKFTGIAVTNPDSLVPLAIRPYRAELSRLASISIDSISFDIVNGSDRDLDLTLIAFPYLECQVFVPDSIAANSTKTGFIKLLPEHLDREFVSSLTIRMNGLSKYERSVTIPIRRKIFSE